MDLSTDSVFSGHYSFMVALSILLVLYAVSRERRLSVLLLRLVRDWKFWRFLLESLSLLTPDRASASRWF